MNPEVYEEFNELEDKHWWFRARRRYLAKLLDVLGLSRSRLSVCEIGSGTGGNLKMLTRFYEVDAVEMNDVARTHIASKAISGVNNVLPGYLPDNISLSTRYDAVFVLDVIEHVEHDQQALAKIGDFLNDEGWLVATVPAYQWLWSAHDEVNQHKRRYTKSEFVRLVESAGFEVHYQSYFNTILFPLAAISRLVQSLRKTDEDDKLDASLKMPHKIINYLFYQIFSFERFVAGKVNIPFGLSIAVVAKKRCHER